MSNNQNNNNTNNNQNQQQGGLLNRVNNGNNNNQNQQQNNQNNNNNNNSLRSRFGNNNNRFGNNNNAPAKPTWTITPMGMAGVKIAFEGIGDPLFRILGTSLDTKMNDATALVERIDEDDSLRQELISTLDKAWQSYGIGGAIIMHPVRKNIQDAFVMGVMPVPEPEQQDNENENNNTGNLPGRNPFSPPVKSPYSAYRAVDATFVLNILGRIRGSVLVDETPIALEVGFLNQAYICDDPRIVEMAIATGAIEENWK